MLKVHIDSLTSLHWADNGTSRDAFEGKPFTGIALTFHQNGVLAEEISYINGYYFGEQITYYPSGQILERDYVTFEGTHGKYERWHENGQKEYEGIADRGFFLTSSEWDKTGKLIKTYSIQDHPEELARYEERKLTKQPRPEGLI